MRATTREEYLEKCKRRKQKKQQKKQPRSQNGILFNPGTGVKASTELLDASEGSSTVSSRSLGLEFIRAVLKVKTAAKKHG